MINKNIKILNKDKIDATSLIQDHLKLDQKFIIKLLNFLKINR